VTDCDSGADGRSVVVEFLDNGRERMAASVTCGRGVVLSDVPEVSHLTVRSVAGVAFDGPEGGRGVALTGRALSNWGRCSGPERRHGR
jgi:hypothetical protein